jgi:hypothetical protein
MIRINEPIIVDEAQFPIGGTKATGDGDHVRRAALEAAGIFGVD